MPEIRYPLPTLIAIVFIGVIVWRGEAMTRPLRSAIADRWRKSMEGPPVPSSDHPQVVAGPITRRGLLLPDGVAASRLPGGPPAETIRLRMFVNIYDVWPLDGKSDYFRVGNRQPIGWVKAADVLPWNTRLVVERKEPGVSSSSSPVLSWDESSVHIAEWPSDAPWRDVRPAERDVALSDLPPDRWGVWLSRDELLELLARVGRLSKGQSTEPLRVRAVLGWLVDDRSISGADLGAAKAYLPRVVFADSAAAEGSPSERLARINENWETEASWGGLHFRAIPLQALP